MSIQNCIDELLMAGADDWVHAPEVTWVAKSIGGANTPDEIKDLSLRLIREVVEHGLMEIGDLPDGDTGQRPLPLKKWPGTPREWLERIESEWNALGRNPKLGEICWLGNTEKGHGIGSRLLEQRPTCANGE